MRRTIPYNLQYHESKCLCCGNDVFEERREQQYPIAYMTCRTCLDKLQNAVCDCKFKYQMINEICVVCTRCETTSCAECKTPMSCTLNNCSIQQICDQCKIPKCIECGLKTNNKVSNYPICYECSLPRCKVCNQGTDSLINNVFICVKCHQIEKAKLIAERLKVFRLRDLQNMARIKKIKRWSGRNKDDLIDHIKSQIEESDILNYKYKHCKHYIINFENSN